MKTARLFLTMIASAALLHGICQADPAHKGNASAASPAGKAVQASQSAAIAPQPSGKPAKPASDSLHGSATQRSIIQPAGPLLTKAPDHGRAPAIVGGPAPSKIKTTAAVSGTGLNHKP